MSLRACTPKCLPMLKRFPKVGVTARRRGNLTQSVILSPSLTVTLSEAKSLISWLRMTASQSAPSRCPVHHAVQGSARDKGSLLAGRQGFTRNDTLFSISTSIEN